MRAALLVVVLTACTTEPTIAVRVVPEGEPLPVYLDAVHAWSMLGFRASFDDTGEPECVETTDLGCQVTVIVQRRPNVDGLADRATRTIIIGAEWSGYYQTLAIGAHEFGHVLLNTGRHTPDGEPAVLARSGATWSVQPADLALACETIGVCL